MGEEWTCGLAHTTFIPDSSSEPSFTAEVKNYHIFWPPLQLGFGKWFGFHQWDAPIQSLKGGSKDTKVQLPMFCYGRSRDLNALSLTLLVLRISKLKSVAFFLAILQSFFCLFPKPCTVESNSYQLGTILFPLQTVVSIWRHFWLSGTRFWLGKWGAGSRNLTAI